MNDKAPEQQIDKGVVRASFERAADQYDAAAVLQKEVGTRLLERLDFMRMQPDRILDLGTGTGRLTRALGKRYRKAQVFGVDIAEAMLKHTRKRASWLSRPRLVCADMEALPFADQSLDMILSNLTLQWSNRPQQVFAEFRRVLRPGGMLLFSTFGPDTLKELRASWSQADGIAHVNRFVDLHDLGDALVQERLAEPVMDMEYLTLTYADARALMRDLKQIGAHNALHARARGLTGKGRLRAMEAAYEDYRREGVLPATYEIVYGHAWAPETDAPRRSESGEIRVPIDQLRGKI